MALVDTIREGQGTGVGTLKEVQQSPFVGLATGHGRKQRSTEKTLKIEKLKNIEKFIARQVFVLEHLDFHHQKENYLIKLPY